MKTLRSSCVLLLILCLFLGGCVKPAGAPAESLMSTVLASGSLPADEVPPAEPTPTTAPTTKVPSADVPSTGSTTGASTSTTGASSLPVSTTAVVTGPAATKGASITAAATAGTTAKSVTTTTVPSTTDAPKTTTTTAPTTREAEKPSNEIRAVWISYLDLSGQLKDRSESTFRAAAKQMTKKMHDAGFNTAFLQVRPNSDAIYRSSVFPYSAAVASKEGADPGYDALRIFCDCAKENGVSVHAWVNLFRVGAASALDKKADSNPAKRILRDGDANNDSRVVTVSGTMYYNPADKDNQDLIVEGVREIVQNYPVAGIHIDDYFYPSTELSIDKKEYDAYREQGGTQSRDDWRRTQISTLVARIYTCVKSFGQSKIFSISPAMSIDKNYSTLYADVKRWAAYSGYCDWLIPQTYTGFEHESSPFRKTVGQWLALQRNANVRLLFGLAAYKCGVDDPYAGSGRKEWINHTDILPRQIRYLRECSGCSGFAMFSYSYIFGEKMSDNSKTEMNSVIDML